MSAPPLALQWSLHETANSALSVARGVMSAATSDNIQALALLACERFGATLAICPETCDKIERLIIGVPRPVRTFFGAYIGYSAGDSATQLVKSKAGVQFLALAAALVTTIGPFHGGLALEAMLGDSASDKTLLPTSRQLKDLLAVLEHRLVASRFAEVVVYCQNLLLELPPDPGQRGNFWKDAKLYPDPDGITKLVDAFRQLNRIGDATFLQLKASACAPWVIAFTKWCLGVSPTIRLLDGTTVLNQPTSCVTVIAVTDQEFGLEITIQRDLHSPAELITADERINEYPNARGRSWTGMVSLAHYWQWARRGYNFDGDLAARCLAEVLPFALHQTVAFLQTTCSWKGDHPDLLPEELLSLVPSPFPADTIIADMFSKLLGLPRRVELRPLPPGTLLADLPAVALYVADLRETCGCHNCGNSEFGSCLARSFFNSLSVVVCDILCLSLFDMPDNLLVHLSYVRQGYPRIEAAILEIITTGKPASCTIDDILHWTLALIGHKIDFREVQDGIARRVLSSEKGQVVYPKLFEAHKITSRGFLTLSWAPGLLRYQDENYSTGLDPRHTGWEPDPVPRNNQTPQVDEPRNLLPGYKLAWLVAQQDGYLEISATLRHELNQRTFGTYPPLMTLQNIAESLVLGACRHDPRTPLDKPDAFARYTGPSLLLKDRRDDGSIIRCVAVEGNAGLALLTMSAFFAGRRLVVRGRACLQCALGVCRRSKIDVLIL